MEKAYLEQGLQLEVYDIWNKLFCLSGFFNHEETGRRYLVEWLGDGMENLKNIDIVYTAGRGWNRSPALKVRYLTCRK